MRRSVFVLALLVGTVLSGYTDGAQVPAPVPVTTAHRAAPAPAAHATPAAAPAHRARAT